jgi:hypothetical protein
MSGMLVSQRPMRLSQDAVRIWEPEGFEVIEDNALVWRWSVARGFAGVDGSESRVLGS